MSKIFGKYTRERVSDIPFDIDDPVYKEYQQKVPHFTGQALYVYSFEKQRMIYAHGWENLLGYKDKTITLLKIISATSKRHFNFSNELNDKALQFLTEITTDLEKYSFTMILGGSLGNIFDRLTYSAVPDFINFHYKSFHWFIFNVADIFITLGVFLLIFKEFFTKKRD